MFLKLFWISSDWCSSTETQFSYGMQRHLVGSERQSHLPKVSFIIVTTCDALDSRSISVLTRFGVQKPAIKDPAAKLQ